MQDVPRDSLRRALDEVFARPEFNWRAARHPLAYLRDLWVRLLDWLDRFESTNPLLFKVFLAVLVLALVALLAHVGYVIWKILRPTAVTGAVAAPVGMRLADARAYADRAEELARAGRYAEALGHRFIAALLELERARALTFHPSKTPAEYVQEARLDAAGRDSLADLVARLYRHLFGAVPCDESAYREFGAAARLVVERVVPH
ncbi:MAG: DUF4129 domain-containing protein [Gemmatimonadetes bacterium]|nr:DUF4129 domain-containing protein [Gemmatimonadota bacterium]